MPALAHNKFLWAKKWLSGAWQLHYSSSSETGHYDFRSHPHGEEHREDEGEAADGEGGEKVAVDDVV